MIQYNTQDLIRKSLQLADLQNSSFVSYEEQLSLLNDAYVKLYNTSIDAGDKLYLCKEDLDACAIGTESVFQLPDNFYSLYSVRDESGFPYSRKSKNYSKGTTWYDLVGNTMIISNALSGHVVVEYYPIPRTLTLKSERKHLKDYDNTEVVGMAGNTIATLKTDELKTQSLVSFDLKTGRQIGEVVLKAGANPNTIVIGQSSFGYLQEPGGGENKKILSSLDGQNETIFPETEKFIRIIGEDRNEITVSSKLGVEFKDDIELSFKDGDIYYEPTNTYLQVNEAKLKVICDGYYEYEVDLDGKTDLHLEFTDGDDVYLIKDGKLYAVNIEDEYFRQIIKSGYDVVSVPKIDFRTGYGYLLKENGKYYFDSCFENTLMDYPNNIYFSLLSYFLAVSYKVKQDADASQLTALAQEEKKQYYDSIERDMNQSYRITNVNAMYY